MNSQRRYCHGHRRLVWPSRSPLPSEGRRRYPFPPTGAPLDVRTGGLLPSLLVRAALEHMLKAIAYRRMYEPALRCDINQSQQGLLLVRGHREGHSDQVPPGQQGELGRHRRCRRQHRDGPVGPDPGTDEPRRARNDHDAPVMAGHDRRPRPVLLDLGRRDHPQLIYAIDTIEPIFFSAAGSPIGSSAVRSARKGGSGLP